MNIHTLPTTQQQTRLVDGVEMLRGLIVALGVNDLQEVANRLSRMANKEPAWGRKYIRNVIDRKLEPGRNLVDAAMRLKAVLDGTPVDIAKSDQVAVHSLGNVRPGSLILSDSKPCAGCGINFVPRVTNQRYHSDGCRREYRRRWKV